MKLTAVRTKSTIIITFENLNAHDIIQSVSILCIDDAIARS